MTSQIARFPPRLLAGALSFCLASCAIAPPPTNPQPTTTSSASPGVTATTSAPPTPTPTPTPAPTRTATVVMNGDLLWHNTVYRSAQPEARRTGKGTDLVRRRPHVRGPEARHLGRRRRDRPGGGAVLRAGRAEPGLPRARRSTADRRMAGKHGYDTCTTDSNHAIDQGFTGLVRTATLLDQAGVRHIGMIRTAQERAKPVIVQTASGVKVGNVEAGTRSTASHCRPTSSGPSRCGTRPTSSRRRTPLAWPARTSLSYRSTAVRSTRRGPPPSDRHSRPRSPPPTTSTWSSASTYMSYSPSRRSTGRGSCTGWATSSRSR